MGHHHLLPYIHGHSHHHQHNPSADVPKGCVAVRVGKEGYDDEPQRFVVPVEYLNHPLFYGLLKVAEDEYGFDQKGTFTLPCRVKEFQSIQELIHQDMHNHHHNHHHHHEQHQHQHPHHHEQHQHQYHQHFKTNSGGSSAGAHHLHLTGCFKA